MGDSTDGMLTSEPYSYSKSFTLSAAEDPGGWMCVGGGGGEGGQPGYSGFRAATSDMGTGGGHCQAGM